VSTKNVNKYLYGPVPSRRFGRSVGIDIIPFKICTFDCIYCQLGTTIEKSHKRRSYFSIDSLIKELTSFIAKERAIDYLTFSGSGEPTLNKNIGKIIENIKSITDIPVIVLTNSSLLWDKEVREDLKDADIVVPSMDAVSVESFNKINRPAGGITLEKVLHGLKIFTQKFSGKIHLEIMFINRMNDNDQEIDLMKNIISGLRIDRIHLNTVVRPPAVKYATPLSEFELKNIQKKLANKVPIEIISHFSAVKKKIYNLEKEEELLQLLKRRPCKFNELALSLSINKSELLKYLSELHKKNLIKKERLNRDSEDYYLTI